MKPLRHPTVRMAVAGLVLALGVLGWTVHRALIFEEALGAIGAPSQAKISDVTPAPAPNVATIRDAVETDPFHPERRRPADRFRMPGEAIAPTAAPSPDDRAPLVLLGTVVLPDGRSFVMCQQGNEPAKIIRLGQSMGEFTLRTVEQARAVFVDKRGERLELRVPKPGNQSGSS